MSKYLAINSDFSGTPGALYAHIQQHYFFRNNNTRTASIIIPYTIITDRNDVVMFNTTDLKLSAGFECKVAKPRFTFRRNPTNFNAMVEASISKQFYRLFQDINITTKEINILPTIRAIYSLDKRIVYPIYFLVFPENKVVKFKPANDTRVTIYPYDDLIAVGLKDKSSDLMTKSVAYLIAVGELGIPIEKKEQGKE